MDWNVILEFLKAIYIPQPTQYLFQITNWIDPNYITAEYVFWLKHEWLWTQPDKVKEAIFEGYNVSFDQVLYNKRKRPTYVGSIVVDWDSTEIPDFGVHPSYILNSGRHYHIGWFFKYLVWYEELQPYKCGMLEKWSEIDPYSRPVIHHYRIPTDMNYKRGVNKPLKLVFFDPSLRYDPFEMFGKLGVVARKCNPTTYKVVKEVG